MKTILQLYVGSEIIKKFIFVLNQMVSKLTVKKLSEQFV